MWALAGESLGNAEARVPAGEPRGPRSPPLFPLIDGARLTGWRGEYPSRP